MTKEAILRKIISYNADGEEDGWNPEYYTLNGEYIGSPGSLRDYKSPNNLDAVNMDMVAYEKAEGISVVKEEIQKEEVFTYTDVMEKVVSPGGNSGRVYVPPEWIGSKVIILRK